MIFQAAGYVGELGPRAIGMWFSTLDDGGLPLALDGAGVVARSQSQDMRGSGLELFPGAGGPGCHLVVVDATNEPEAWSGLGPSWAVVLTAGTAGAAPLAGRLVGQFTTAGG